MDLAVNKLQRLIYHKTQTITTTTGPYQVLPLWARVDLGAMAMKGYSAFHKTTALLEPYHQIL